MGTYTGYGYDAGTVRVRYGYGTWVRTVGTYTGTVYPPYLFSENVVLFPKCAAISATFWK